MNIVGPATELSRSQRRPFLYSVNQDVCRSVWVGVASLIFTTSVFAQQVNNSPDAIFYNGKIVTVDSGFSIRQAFAIKGDQYVAVGDNNTVRKLASKSTRLVDLKGAEVTPGLSDNHDHLYATEKVMRGIDLVGATSTEEIVKRMRAGMANARPGETVFGSVGWRAQITKKDLDAISTEVPIVVLRNRRGSAVFNTAALTKAGITNDMQSYMGEKVPRDKNGELSGELPDWPAGYYAVDKVVPMPTMAEEERMILHGQQERNSLGITSIRDLANFPEGMRAYTRMWRDGKLTIRISMGLDLPDRKDPGGRAREQGMIPWFGDHWLRVDSLGEEPWMMPLSEYMRVFPELIRMGWRHATHTPDNETLEKLLQTYEAIDRDTPLRDRRLVVEHIPTVTPELMDRLEKLGIVVSTNIAGYFNYNAVAKREGDAVAARQTPVRELLDHHLIVVSGFDYNGPNPDTMFPNNPFIYMYYYVARKTSDGRVVGPQEKISRQEALRIATYNNAYTTWEEKVKGSIEPGKLADFVVLSGDFLTVPEDEILKLHPLATYVGGRQVYSAPN